MFKNMFERWRGLSPKKRLQAQIIIAFMLVGMYGIAFYPTTDGKFQNSKKMLHRIKDRMEKQADLSNIGGNGVNPRVIARKIEEAGERLQELSDAFDELNTGFAPVDSSDVRQQLMLEISNLAARSGVELLSVSVKGFTSEEGKFIAPVDKVLGRPLIVVTANARFWQLHDFLHGLKDLSYYVSVMNLKIYSQNLKGGSGSDTHVSAGVLSVSLEVSI